MRNVTTQCLKPSSAGAHKAEESKYLISGPQPQEASQLQKTLKEIPRSHMKRTSMGSRDQVLGFEGIATRDTPETTSSEGATIMAAVSRAETHPRELVTDSGVAGRRIHRTPASIRRFLEHTEDGQTLFRFSGPPNPSPGAPYERLFGDLDSLGLAPQEESPEGEYGEEGPSRGTPQHRNIGQSLDEILYLPSCG